jgi:hypothetical protein
METTGQHSRRAMSSKKLTAIAATLMIALLVLPATADAARPNRGVWKGTLTRWWNNGQWQHFQRTNPRVSFPAEAR